MNLTTLRVLERWHRAALAVQKQMAAARAAVVARQLAEMRRAR